MNYERVFKTLVDETEKYIRGNGLNTMVLGISGGLDSTVTAAICHEVERKNPKIRFIGVSLPCSSNSGTENNSANTCMKAFCRAGNYWVENLQKEYSLIKSTCEVHGNSTHISQGNLKARLRMMYLYNLASINKGIVMDTDNLTEHYLGFFTIHGDVADFNPIGGLWKHEVYELAKYIREYYAGMLYQCYDANKINALDFAINIMPTDGNGVNCFGDMGQIAPAFVHDKNIEAYTKVDDIINTYLHAKTLHPDEYQLMMAELHNKYDVYDEKRDSIIYDTVDTIISRINNTEYKRKGLPIVIPRKLYEPQLVA